MRQLPSLLEGPARASSAFGMRSTLIALGLFLPLVTAPDLHAQIFTGVEPAQPFVIPRRPVKTNPIFSVTASSSPDTRDAAPRPVEIIRHLPNGLEGFELAGETGALRWPLYFTHTQAATTRHFKLAYLSAVSVLDDASALTLQINGKNAGSIAINSPRGFKEVDIEIPPGMLVDGYNAVSVSWRQRHRIDCSVAATYELWTRIDPSRTGFVITGNAQGITGAADIPALPLSPEGLFPIRVVLSGKTNIHNVQRLVATTQRIAIAGQFLQPAIDFGAPSDDPYGMNLVLGTRDVLSGFPELSAAAGRSGPVVKLVSLNTNARPTLIVTGSTEAELDLAIAELERLRPKEGSGSGERLSTSYPGYRTGGATAITLGDLDIQSQEFPGRLSRQSFNITLPPDFLPADYARGTFDVAGGYAAGLTSDAQVRIDINGRNAAQVNLPKKDGDVFRHNQMYIPLGLMQPGLNRFVISAETPSRQDAACDASQALNREGRFLLLDSSLLTLPGLARIEHYPELNAMAAGGLPFVKGHSTLYVPAPDRDTMAAALSFLARLAVAAGSVTPVDFTFSPPVGDPGSLLIVAPARLLDPTVLNQIGLNHEAIEAAWRERAESASIRQTASTDDRKWWTDEPRGPSACHVQTTLRAIEQKSSAPPASIGSRSTDPKRDDDELFVRWTENFRSSSSWKDRLGGIGARILEWTAAAGDRFSPSSAAVALPVVTAKTSLIAAQGYSANWPSSVTTIITAPDPTTLRESISCLGDLQVWTKLRGRFSALDASDGTVTAIAAESLRYSMGPTNSLANSRLVLAGWLSLNPLAYVLIALATAACLSGTTLLFVRGIGRKVKK